MVKIYSITENNILNGFKFFCHCCMFGINKNKNVCKMWIHLYKKVGGIGYLLKDKDNIIGQLIYLPKKYARKIALPTTATNNDLNTAMVIGCLYVLPDYRNNGYAGKMIKKLISFCNKNKFRYIEANVDPRPASESMGRYGRRSRVGRKR